MSKQRSGLGVLFGLQSPVLAVRREKDVRVMDATRQYLLTLTKQAIWQEEPSLPPKQLDWGQNCFVRLAREIYYLF